MKTIRTAVGLAAVAMAASVCSYQEVYAGGYSAPSGIEISVDSFEIDRSDLHGDTLVELPVYINNNEGFVSLNLVFELDPRLRFDRNSIMNESDGIRAVNVNKCLDSENMISVSFEAEDRFVDDGKLGTFRVIVPGNTEAGTYELALRESGGDYDIRIFTYNKRGADYGAECFSLLQGGTITVTNNYREQPQPPTQQQQQQREPQELPEPERENEPDDEQGNGNEKSDDDTQTTSSSNTKVSTTTTKAKKKTTSNRSTTKVTTINTRWTTTAVLFETSKPTYTLTSTSTQTTSTQVIYVYEEKNETDYANSAFIFASAAFFIAVCTIVIMEIIKGGN